MGEKAQKEHEARLAAITAQGSGQATGARAGGNGGGASFFMKFADGATTGTGNTEGATTAYGAGFTADQPTCMREGGLCAGDPKNGVPHDMKACRYACTECTAFFSPFE